MASHAFSIGDRPTRETPHLTIDEACCRCTTTRKGAVPEFPPLTFGNFQASRENEMSYQGPLRSYSSQGTLWVLQRGSLDLHNQDLSNWYTHTTPYTFCYRFKPDKSPSTEGLREEALRYAVRPEHIARSAIQAIEGSQWPLATHTVEDITLTHQRAPRIATQEAFSRLKLEVRCSPLGVSAGDPHPQQAFLDFCTTLARNSSEDSSSTTLDEFDLEPLFLPSKEEDDTQVSNVGPIPRRRSCRPPPYSKRAETKTPGRPPRLPPPGD